MFSSFLRMIHGFVLVIGPKSAGKTSIINRLSTGKFEQTDPTLGYNEEQIAKVRIIEIGGQSNFQDYWPIIVEQKPVHIFYIVDITQKKDFDSFWNFIKKNSSNMDHLEDITTLCFNKSDLTTEIKPNLAMPKNYLLCSAKVGDGMMDILEKIASFGEGSKINDSNSLLEPLQDNSGDEIEKINKIKDEFEGKF